ncbi:hypothetical protein K501DRAFT_262819 [Backusella circina FSU 941]|nr:hypothetical protein K501DRAFT_262819 [Backusella circina FSU 941]
MSSSDPTTSLKLLLERSKLLNKNIIHHELPEIERNLAQIGAQSDKLTSIGSTGNGEVDTRAQYFLANSGVNTQVLIRELGTIHLGGTTDHRQPIQDTNIEDYLTQKRQEKILALVNEGRQKITNDTNDAFKSDVNDYWIDLRKQLTSSIKNSSSELENFDATKAKFDSSRVQSAGTWIELS